ncbi:MAG: phosphate ABC transporter ATP-binding protein [Armatimonadetes bacterium]|nr:phosphate ABC transporter ATP-binding protein [Armatimonadota bacterium]MDE2205736.1 phosphate ABC transporter ATP-binding protein [Armatimonadota bacterium]
MVTAPAKTAVFTAEARSETVAAPSIETRDLSAWYGSQSALQSVSMLLRPNAVTALMGPSGCGKSTFLRCLNRLADETPGFRRTGVVTIDGVDVTSRNVRVEELRRRVGMVFQRPNPFPMSIFANVAYGPRLHGMAHGKGLEALVEQALRRAALWDQVKDRLRKSALELSGGQQQRLCIARAIAVEPAALLLDEPSASLDPASTADIEALIASLKTSYTLVMVTHDIAQARRVSDWAALLWDGGLVEAGPSSDLLHNPMQPRTQRYLDGHLA